MTASEALAAQRDAGAALLRSAILVKAASEGDPKAICWSLGHQTVGGWQHRMSGDVYDSLPDWARVPGKPLLVSDNIRAVTFCRRCARVWR